MDDAMTFLRDLTLRAEASHILIKGTDVESEQMIDALAQDIGNDPTKFAAAAKAYSECPSGQRQGGSLGEFGRYSMVPEFEKVVFYEAIDVVHKVKTSFGYHLILTHKRSEHHAKHWLNKW
eukprot:CAMPEP_0198286454 /NCGR_PEP_ID=MMETSP1449-20131203/5540_1 /TAXON_ID=420275 /ORGANISM="Attheya septentrionalis, Strain CCMP2084" /LENGTH=120 /DNA_ID=CAMNT_0043984209 /DNA_START=126 /DNA_END=488 /DNA_ORIENTATION=-